MAASIQFRPQNRDLGMVMREVDEDLAIFLGIRNVEIEKNDPLLVDESHHLDDDGLKCKNPQPDSLLETCLVGADDSFLSLEMERSDHDWLLNQPDSSSLPSFDTEAQDSAATDQTKLSNGEDKAILLKSEVDVITSSCVTESSSPLEKSASVESKRPSSSKEGRPSRCRATTPTSRPSLSAKSRPSRNSTPTSRPTLLPSSKPVAPQPRSSTPVRPTLLPSSKPSKSASRSATPTRKPAVDQASSSGKKIGPTVSKTKPSQEADQNPKVSMPKRAKPSQEADQNPKVSIPKRAASASRGRVSSHSSSSSTSSSSSSSSNEKPRQKSCSPTRVRAPIITGYKSGSKVLSRSRGYGNGEDDNVNPVVMGTKMVDRVVNMRKLAPPKQDEYVCKESTRKSSQENSGFGRSLSKKSLEMAMRHMDIGPHLPNKSRTSAATNSDSSKPSS